MARVLTCLDAVPAQDGTCASSAWVEQPSVLDVLPTVEQAHAVGGTMFAVLVGIAALSLLLPDREIHDA